MYIAVYQLQIIRVDGEGPYGVVAAWLLLGCYLVAAWWYGDGMVMV